jgi:hypothetical protein
LRRILSFSDAESAEDEIKDVIARRSAGEGVEGVESFGKIEENHLVGNGGSCGLPGAVEC